MPETNQKSPHPIDRHVGNRIRMRRILVGMTQQRLAEALKITFQQVQKYEKGTNRVSASRLQQIATLLGVEVGFFYEGVAQVPGGAGEADRQAVLMAEVSSSPEGIRLMNSFARIPDPAMRRKLADLAEGIAQMSGNQAEQSRPRPRMRKAG